MAKKEVWDPQKVLFAVRQKGSNLQRLGLQNGFFRHTLHKSLTERFPRAHQVIAEFLGVPRHEIWPQFYHADDTLKTFRQVRADLVRAA